MAIGSAGYAVAMSADFGFVLSSTLTQAPFDVTAEGLVGTRGMFNEPAMTVG